MLEIGIVLPDRCGVGVVSEPGNGRGLARRQLLALPALSLLAACATESETTAEATAESRPAASTPAASRPAARVTPRSAPAVTKMAATARGSGGAVPYHTGKALLGSYLALQGLSLTQSLALRRKQLGRGQRIVHKFYPWSANVPAREADVPADSVLMVSMNGARYGQINNGASDKLIALAAARFAAMKRPIMLRWGWEMNGNWFAWDGTHNSRKPSGYITAWQRLHRIFAEHGAKNVAWVWAPNWNSGPNVSWNHMEHYYPGDAYVDWVGVSGYDFSGESPTTLFSGICESYGHRKPIVLAETAAVGSSTAKTKWINKLSAYVNATPAVGAVVWFDTDVQHGSPYNFRPDTNASVLSAYRAMARSTRFSG